MTAPVNASTSSNQSYDPGLSSEEGAGGASNAGYEGGARGAGHAAPTKPADQTDDRCFQETVTAASACLKLVRGFDAFQIAACTVAVTNLAECVKDRVDNPKP